ARRRGAAWLSLPRGGPTLETENSVRAEKWTLKQVQGDGECRSIEFLKGQEEESGEIQSQQGDQNPESDTRPEAHRMAFAQFAHRLTTFQITHDGPRDQHTDD